MSIGLVFAAAPAWSQTTTASAQSAENPTIESVVISAQKRPEAERAQDVPLSLTVVNNVDLAELHTRNLQDLATTAPNVTLLSPVQGYATFAIRGLGVNTTIPSIEPAVGVFVDGIYLGTSVGSVVDVIDVENVEILRGPQGLLFGRNTTGGAVLVNSRRPGDSFSVYGAANFETGPEETILASVEGPLGTKFRAKVTGYYSNDSGWFTNEFDGRAFGLSRSYLVRPIVVWTPTTAFDTTLIYERGSRRGDGPVAQNPKFFDGFTIDLNDRGYDHLDWQSVTVESNWRAASGVFTNLAGYRTLDQGISVDNDGTPNPGFFLSALLRQHQFSEELRYSGQIFDSVVLTTGLYYFTQSYMYLERRLLFGATIDSTLGGHVDADNYAAFAQADYAVTPELTLIAGGRFTREKKGVRIATFVPSTALSRCNFAAETCVFNFPGPAFPNSPGATTWDNFTPKLGFQWQDSDDLMVYGSWTRGVRSGGYNVRNTSTSVPPGPYDPELQDAFEVGWKSTWFERRLRFNTALFHNTIKKLQRDVNQLDPVVGIVQVTRNTADATIQGFEIELAGALTNELVLYANTGYTDGRYDKVFFDLDGGGISASDLHLAIPRLSPWGYALGALYTNDLPGGYTFKFRSDYGYRSRAASADDNGAYLLPIEDLSASASVTLPDGHWTLSVYGRNLLNKLFVGVHALLPAALGGGSFQTLNEGRVIGLEASFTY